MNIGGISSAQECECKRNYTIKIPRRGKALPLLGINHGEY